MGRPYKGIRTNEEERKYLEALDLFPDKVLRFNERGNKLQWYGNRLRLIMLYHSKTMQEIARVCFTTSQNVSHWMRNVSRPTKNQVKQIGFLFEIDPKFFFLSEVTVTFKEQTTITYEPKHDAASDKGKEGNTPDRVLQPERTIGDVET